MLPQMPNRNPRILHDHTDKLLQWRRAWFWYRNLILIVTAVLQVGGFQKGRAMKHGNKKNLQGGSRQQRPFNISSWFPEAATTPASRGSPWIKMGFYHGQSFVHVSSPNWSLLKHVPARLNACLAALQRNTFSQLLTRNAKGWINGS